MVALVHQKLDSLGLSGFEFKHKKLLLPLMLVLLLTNSHTGMLTLSVLSDAFWQVAVFVASTLVLYRWISQRLAATPLSQSFLLKTETGQIVFAALMGAVPGCGGAIVVMTQFVSGNIGFGAVVAVLTSTMGDAAFVLLAGEPTTGLMLIALSMVVGIVSGIAVSKLHGIEFLRHTPDTTNASCSSSSSSHKPIEASIPQFLQATIWQIIVLPCALIALLMAAQVDVAALFSVPASAFTFTGAALMLVLLTLWSLSSDTQENEREIPACKHSESPLFHQVASDTGFVTTWVVLAFMAFELLRYYADLDLAGYFHALPALMPLVGVLVGLIPGCGPQIITTSLYLNGDISLSAQLGNAISNDGDALFPALALSPRAALWATLYSTIPALITAYGYYWLFE